jgi:hypothetical protein
MGWSPAPQTNFRTRTVGRNSIRALLSQELAMGTGMQPDGFGELAQPSSVSALIDNI